MTLLFGHRPFDFSDFFNLVMTGEIDFSSLNYIDVMKKSLEAGFKHIEITGDLPDTLPGILTEETIEQLIEIKKKENITYSVHLPLWAMEPGAFSKRIRTGTTQAFIDCIELTKPLDPVCWVMHPTGTLTVEFINMGLPDFAKGLIIQQFVSNAEEVIKETLNGTDIDSAKIAIENIEFPFESYIPFIEKYNLSICFDTGHLLAGYSGELKVMEFIEKFYDRIIELHLHDGRNPKIDHKPLGEYDLPEKQLLMFLKERNFSGPLVYELTLSEAIASMKYLDSNFQEVLK